MDFELTAVEDGDDFLITGNKMFITNGTICDWMVVQAVTDPGEKIHRSFSQFIVPADLPGIVRTKIKGKLGIRASDTAEIALDGVRIPKSNLVQKWYRDAKILELYEGTKEAEIMTLGRVLMS